ncbi:MAG: DTW domain-containing protein [Verrucomicrobiales bacterium]|nr:DTW domain-containing protein [Verrucomicrobiales bacterium]
MSNPFPRRVCERCRRPATACWCTGLEPVDTSVRVVFLQHPREARVAIGTARIAHLGLSRSELHEGMAFAENPVVADILARPGTALLFPGADAVDPQTLDRPPNTLVVIDGTWPQARKMLSLNPTLRALPRIGFVPRKPGNYRIRREPAAHCVATVEAVVEVLRVFERDTEKFEPLLRAFDRMVDTQLAATAARIEPPRRRHKPGAPWWTSPFMPDLDSLWPRLVAVAAEANAHRRGTQVPGHPEIIQLAGRRLSTGELFHVFLAPRRPLAPSAAHHLGVPAECLLGGTTVDRGLAEWTRFLQPGDRLIGWGPFAWDLLKQEDWHPESTPIDLRLMAVHRLKRSPGGLEGAVNAIGAILGDEPSAPGRAGRNLRAIGAFTAALLAEKRLAGPG